VDLTQALLLVLAGVAAGAVNTLAGAGSLLTFPALLAAGLPPLVANVTNRLGVIPGSISGAYRMRGQLVGEGRRLWRLSAWVAAGSVLGAVLLLSLPGDSFEAIVPVLVGAAGLLVLAQPLVVRMRRARPARAGALGPVMGAVAIYSGYFGAAQGVAFIGVLGVLDPQSLRRTNAVKNVLAVSANGAAGLVYVVVAPVDWTAGLLVALGSACGGPIGAALATRVPAGPLRLAIALFSLLVAVRLALSSW